MDIDFSVTKNGKELDKSLYTWDENSKTFSTCENGLVLDFISVNGCTFKTGFGCTFKTDDCCTFDVDDGCTFKTGEECVAVRRGIFEIIKLEKGVKIKI